MNILPSFLEEDIEEAEADIDDDQDQDENLPVEYGINFKTGQLTGKLVYGLEALKVWIFLCLMTQRYRYPVYSWDYGIDLEQYIGKTYSADFVQTDSEDEIKEALTINDHIQDVQDFTVDRDDDSVKISCTVITDYGNVEVEDSNVRG